MPPEDLVAWVTGLLAALGHDTGGVATKQTNPVEGLGAGQFLTFRVACVGLATKRQIWWRDWVPVNS